MLTLFLSAFVTDITRSDLNIAIVAMTEPIETNDTSLDACPHQMIYDLEIEFFETGNFTYGFEHHEIPIEFNRRQYPWNQEVQGLVLGSFFWAMMIFQIPTGSMAQKFGGKFVVSACLIGSCLISFATPYITDYHVFVFCGLRFILGIFQAGIYPAGFGMICNWFPLKERSLCFSILDAGSYIGSVVTFFCSGYITLEYGWPMLFFMPGTIAAVVFILFTLISTSQPHNHPCISKQELDFITRDPQDEIKKKTVTSVKDLDREEGQKEEEDGKTSRCNTPWVAIFTNRAVNAATLIKFSIGWNFAVFYLEMPKYLNEIIHEEIRANGIINAGVNLLTGVTMVMTGCLSEKIIEGNYLSRTTTRKIFACFSGLGYGLCMMLIPAVGCDALKLKYIMLTCATLAGFQGGSDLPLASEMSKHYPATIYAIVNNVALAAGFMVPTYTGIILSDVTDQWFGWSIVFYTSAGISILSFIFFMFCASSDRQDFDFSPEERIAKQIVYEAQAVRLPVHKGWYVD